MTDNGIISLKGIDDEFLNDTRLYAIQIVFDTESASKLIYNTNWLNIQNTDTWKFDENNFNFEELDYIGNTINLDNDNNLILLKNTTIPIVEILKNNGERPYLNLNSIDTQVVVKSNSTYYTYKLNNENLDYNLSIVNDIESNVSLLLLDNEIYVGGTDNENLSDLVLETVQIHFNSDSNLVGNYTFNWDLEDSTSNNIWLKSVDNFTLTTEIDAMISNTIVASETNPLSTNIKNKTIKIGEIQSSDTITLNTNSIYSQIVLYDTINQKHITFRKNYQSPEFKLKIDNL